MRDQAQPEPTARGVWKIARFRLDPCPYPRIEMIGCLDCSQWITPDGGIAWFHRRITCEQARRTAELWTHSELQVEKE